MQYFYGVIVLLKAKGGIDMDIDNRQPIKAASSGLKVSLPDGFSVQLAHIGHIMFCWF